MNCTAAWRLYSWIPVVTCIPSPLLTLLSYPLQAAPQLAPSWWSLVASRQEAEDKREDCCQSALQSHSLLSWDQESQPECFQTSPISHSKCWHGFAFKSICLSWIPVAITLLIQRSHNQVLLVQLIHMSQVTREIMQRTQILNLPSISHTSVTTLVHYQHSKAWCCTWQKPWLPCAQIKCQHQDMSTSWEWVGLGPRSQVIYMAEQQVIATQSEG